MESQPVRREGELTDAQAAIVKRIFIALGFLALTAVILALDVLVPIQYVVLGLIIAGLAGVLYFDLLRRPKK
jgi:hypothetical protein